MLESTPSKIYQATDSSADPEAEQYTRLHIAPFDAELLKVVVSSSILPKARAISYHSVETFPERRFGFVELPAVDAEKLKKKLNGTTLRGAKMKIEKARPETWADPDPDESDKEKKRKKKKSKDDDKKPKKRKRDYNVLEGVELDDGRKVKRGWTITDEDKIKEKRKLKKDKDSEKKEKKDKKDKKKHREERSKYTDKEECLLKTKLPAPPESAETDEADRKKRKKGKAREVIIHEFANTTKFPTFLRANKPASVAEPGSTEFVEGRGWVDSEGNVVEAVKTKRAARSESKSTRKKAPAPEPIEDDTTSSSGGSSDEEEASKSKVPFSKTSAPAAGDTTSSSGTSSEEESDSDDEKPSGSTIATPAKIPKAHKPESKDDGGKSTSSSGDSSEDEKLEKLDTVQASKIAPIAIPSPVSAMKAEASRPKSSSSSVSLTIKIPPATPGKVHPLEALYKRNKDATTPSVDEAKPFSFFDADDIEEGGGAPGGGQIPMTPFTQEEFEWRNVRSAAPTPDTAHPSRIKNFWAGTMDAPPDIEEEEENEEDATMDDLNIGQGESSAAAEEGSAPGGDFSKWFWENRRNLNQSWMKRKKTAAKEKRHRENKSRATKAG